jgi:geranylgeranyl diphosphate synthase type II
VTVSVPGRVAGLLEEERARIAAAMDRLVRSRVESLPVALRGPVQYALGGGGKRLRPLLCVRTFRALAGREPVEAVYDAACAIEWVHSYSLVHDDLPCMDDDDLRRGRATTHRVFGSATAAVVGALMIPLALSLLEDACDAAGLGSGGAAEAVRDLARAAGAEGMVGGQVLDLEAETHPVGLTGLETIHRMKTGALFAASFRLGGRLAGADARAIDVLGRAGTSLGLAFQVADDILDETGATSVLGKTAGADRAHGKATCPGLLGLTAARARAGEEAAAARAALAEAGARDELLEYLVTLAVERDR